MDETHSADENLEAETKTQQDLEPQDQAKRCIYCAKVINEETSICDDCLKGQQMEENAVDTNPLRKKNMRVFLVGALIAFLGSLLIIFVNYDYFREGTRYSGIYDTGGALNDLANFTTAICCNILYVVAIVQLAFFIIVNLLTWRKIAISGAKMWVFIAFELLFVVTLLILIQSGLVLDWIIAYVTR